MRRIAQPRQHAFAPSSLCVKAPKRSNSKPAYAMRAVVQRVKSASVKVEGEIVSSIGPGLLCLIGIKEGDMEKDAEFMLWPGQDGVKSWDQSVVQRGYEAKEEYQSFVCRVQKDYMKVKDGIFGAMMEVELVNDGPVTMSFDSEFPGGR